MRTKRGPLVRNAGGSIPDYVKRATSSIERAKFEEDLRSYMSAQNVTLEIDRTTADTLFGISLHFLKLRFAALDIKKARLAQDWKAQRRMARELEKRLVEVKELAETYQRSARGPNTSSLAESVVMKTDDLLRELEDVAVFQRARASMLPQLMFSAKSTKSYVWELDAYLQHRIPWLQSKERELIIAATLIASGLKSDDGDKDHAANIPMARSRANIAMKGEENAVSWLDQAPLRQEPQSSAHKPQRERKRISG
jgi:hypothetical protein